MLAERDLVGGVHQKPGLRVHHEFHARLRRRSPACALGVTDNLYLNVGACAPGEHDDKYLYLNVRELCVSVCSCTS
jgi:hypothetical protein